MTFSKYYLILLVILLVYMLNFKLVSSLFEVQVLSLLVFQGNSGYSVNVGTIYATVSDVHYQTSLCRALFLKWTVDWPLWEEGSCT